MSSTNLNRRILVVDDNQAIHDDFHKLLVPCQDAAADAAELDDLAAELLGDGAGTKNRRDQPSYELTSALQGREALEIVTANADRDLPFAMVFMDVRMPPGWDGIETLQRLWEVDPELQAVVCTAYADYSYEEILERLGDTDRFLILKKPFDAIEVQQLASTLTNRWKLRRDIRERTVQIEAYARSLETVNLALEADKRVAESFARSQSEFVLGAGRAFGQPAKDLMDRLNLVADRLPNADEVLGLAGDLADGLHDLADLAALETGERRAHVEQCSLTELLGTVADSARSRCARRELPVCLTQTNPIPDSAHLDGDLLKRILESAIAWSADRADARGLSLCLSMDDTNAAAPELKLTLEFHGQPLTEEQRELLFMPFRSPASRPERALALPLAQLSAQELGATLALDAMFDGTTRLVLRVDPGPGGGGERVTLWNSAA